MYSEQNEEIESFRYVKAARRLLKDITVTLENIASDKSSNDELRLECLLSLGKIGDPESLNTLLNAFQEMSDYVEPVTALGFYKNGGSVAKLLERLQDPDVNYKDEIVRVLGEIGDPMAEKVLMELLRDEDRMVRYYSARALFQMGGRNVVQALCGLLNDPDEWIVINVLDILSKMQDTDSIPALVGQLEVSREARLKAIIISSLASFKDGKLLEVFEKALESYDPRIQANAVEAIAALKIPGPEIKRKLKKFYGHPNNRVRANVCLALASVDPDAVMAELEEMLGSREAPIRRSAAYVLGNISNPKCGEYIHKLLRDENEGVRKTALRAALSFGEEFSLSEIMPLLKDKSEWVRREAVECAIKIADFPDESIISMFKTEKSSPVIEVLLKYIVKRNIKSAVDLIYSRAKLEVEEESEWIISALGHLGARDKLLELKKFLGSVRAGVYSEYYVALLQNGDLSIFNELLKGFSNKKRIYDMIVFANACGSVGALLQKVEDYSFALKQALTNEVMADMQEIETYSPSDVSIDELMNRGKEYYNNKEFSKAKEEFLSIIGFNSDNIEAGYYLGSSMFYLGEMIEAENVLSHVLTIAPENIQTGILLGQVYFKQKEWQKLSDCYQKLKDHLKSDDKKNTIRVYGALGLAYYNLKQYQEAIKALTIGLKANPRDLSSTYHLALCYYSLGKVDQAKMILEGLKKTLPVDSQVLKNVLDLLQRI